MKALVISDRQEIIDYVNPLLKEKGFDLIHYRWIIKALDNIEEIQPDVIVLSSTEYPRHWKTLAGFVQSGIGGNDVKVYIYDPSPLSYEENKKASDLGVKQFKEDFPKRNCLPVEVAFNEPATGAINFCSGNYYPDEKVAECEASIDFSNTFVKYVTLYDGNNITSFSAEAEKADCRLCFHVKEYYEKAI